MKYLTPGQIEQQFDSKSESEQLDIMKKAFTLKDIHPEYSKADCIALSMDYVKCISGSGMYEKF